MTAYREVEDLDAELRRRWSAGRVWAAHEAPYLASALLALAPVVIDETDGAARHDLRAFPVDRRWHVYLDPSVLGAIEVGELGFWLLHQVSHLLRVHAARFPGETPAGDGPFAGARATSGAGTSQPTASRRRPAHAAPRPSQARGPSRRRRPSGRPDGRAVLGRAGGRRASGVRLRQRMRRRRAAWDCDRPGLSPRRPAPGRPRDRAAHPRALADPRPRPRGMAALGRGPARADGRLATPARRAGAPQRHPGRRARRLHLRPPVAPLGRGARRHPARPAPAHPQVAVVIDTSGSVSDAMLGEALRQGHRRRAGARRRARGTAGALLRRAGLRGAARARGRAPHAHQQQGHRHGRRAGRRRRVAAAPGRDRRAHRWLHALARASAGRTRVVVGLPRTRRQRPLVGPHVLVGLVAA